jgi:hypothetical protein
MVGRTRWSREGEEADADDQRRRGMRVAMIHRERTDFLWEEVLPSYLLVLCRFSGFLFTNF